ncbi:glycosyltransferase family 4 protein [Balneola sp. MJW-20]|uniref:glycosyltransferase family 4 protein n=1 Tax=Gracilimonas aurantiaca TaxID=3234185 RepID=UPI0034668ECB
MKIAYAASPGIDSVNGGLRRQVEATTTGVKEAGHHIYRVKEPYELEADIPDLLHIFSVGFETIEMIRFAHSQGIPLILSPVMFTNHSLNKLKWGLKLNKIASRITGRISNELLIKEEGCKLADHLLPNTSQEALLLQKVFNIPKERVSTIPNGVELRFQHGDPELFESEYKLKNFILFTGQAYARRKNVISLLRISKQVNKDIVIIGDFKDDPYSKECLKLASNADNVLLIPTLDHDSDMLRSAYAAAEVFVLPSWFETPGIAAMEAALAGCKIVITGKGGTRDYFADHAKYIDPGSDTDLLRGINEALSSVADDQLKERILKYYRWDNAVSKTLNVYQMYT